MEVTAFWVNNVPTLCGLCLRLIIAHAVPVEDRQTRAKDWGVNADEPTGRRLNSYLLPNLKHLLCFDSVMVDVGSLIWLFCFTSGSFSMALINFRKCLIYSGYVSKLQWPPPLIHKGSYFILDSSHKRFPWVQSTMSSAVPYKQIKRD